MPGSWQSPKQIQDGMLQLNLWVRLRSQKYSVIRAGYVQTTCMIFRSFTLTDSKFTRDSNDV